MKCPPLHPDHHSRTRSWISWSTSSLSLLTFLWGCFRFRDELQTSVVLWYCLFLLLLSSLILSSRGLVLPSSRLRAMDTYSGWSSVSASAFPASPLSTIPSSSGRMSDIEELDASLRSLLTFFKSSKYLFFESLGPERPGVGVESSWSSFLLVISSFQLSLNAASSSSAIFFKHRWEIKEVQYYKNSAKGLYLLNTLSLKSRNSAPTQNKHASFAINSPRRDSVLQHISSASF